jgi:hypothetical protein
MCYSYIRVEFDSAPLTNALISACCILFGFSFAVEISRPAPVVELSSWLAAFVAVVVRPKHFIAGTLVGKLCYDIDPDGTIELL